MIEYRYWSIFIDVQYLLFIDFHRCSSISIDVSAFLPLSSWGHHGNSMLQRAFQKTSEFLCTSEHLSLEGFLQPRCHACLATGEGEHIPHPYVYMGITEWIHHIQTLVIISYPGLELLLASISVTHELDLVWSCRRHVFTGSLPFGILSGVSVSILLAGAPIFRNLAFTTSFEVSMLPGRVRICGNWMLERSVYASTSWALIVGILIFRALLEACMLPCLGACFLKSFFSKICVKCLCSPAGVLYHIIQIANDWHVAMAHLSTASERPIQIRSDLWPDS